MVTDLNFPFNQVRSVHRSFSREDGLILRKALKRSVARRLPVLSVRGLEAFALPACYRDYLVFRGEQIAHRSERCTHCTSPWQSIPVRADGTLTVCDCSPDAVIGNIYHMPFSKLWNGPVMVEYRQRMLGETPPETCLACPRF